MSILASALDAEMVPAIFFPAAGAFITFDHWFQKGKEPTFEQQINRLQEVENSLGSLATFVQDQRKKLSESQAVVEGLKSEHEKLKPIVKSDQKVVEAVLNAQADRQELYVWRERAIGIVIGTFGSLLAAGIIYLGAKWWSRGKAPTAQQIMTADSGTEEPHPPG